MLHGLSVGPRVFGTMTHLIFPLENFFLTWEFFGHQSNN